MSGAGDARMGAQAPRRPRPPAHKGWRSRSGHWPGGGRRRAPPSRRRNAADRSRRRRLRRSPRPVSTSAKADEGVQVVLGLAHLMLVVEGAGDLRIGAPLHQMRLVARAPQQAIEQIETIGRAVEQRLLGQLDERLGRGEGAGGRRGAGPRRRTAPPRPRPPSGRLPAPPPASRSRRAASRQPATSVGPASTRGVHAAYRTAQLIGPGASGRRGRRRRSGRRAPVGGDDERLELLHRAGEPRRDRPAAAARAAGRRSAGPPTRTPRPGTRSSISRSARVDVDRKAPAVVQRPGELGVDVRVEHAARRGGGDLLAARSRSTRSSQSAW